MSDFKALCLKYFKTDDLYKILKLESSATDNELRKNYYKLSLEIHPDKVKPEEREVATEKFKLINIAHSILSDEKKRNLYDLGGDVGELNVSGEEWYVYWKNFFDNVTPESIDDYEKNYKGSDEEKEDLKASYLKHKGDMSAILQEVLFAHPKEEQRYHDILLPLIEKGDLPMYTKFTDESELAKLTRKRKYAVEEKKADKIKNPAKKASGEGVDTSSEESTSDESSLEENSSVDYSSDDDEVPRKPIARCNILRKVIPKPTETTPKKVAPEKAPGPEEEADLIKAIADRQAQRAENADMFFEKLENKYSKKK